MRNYKSNRNRRAQFRIRGAIRGSRTAVRLARSRCYVNPIVGRLPFDYRRQTSASDDVLYLFDHG